MLRVYIDEMIAELAEELQCHRSVVDEGARLARGTEFAADDALRGIEIDIAVGKERFEPVARDIENGLDDALFCPRLYGFDVGTVAENHAQGPEDDTLSRSRLTGDDRESGGKVDVELVDERVIAYI